MCGISCIFTNEKLKDEDRFDIDGMHKSLQHRGPDDEGFYQDEHCLLAHRRLAIIDLSTDGRQPFTTEDGRYQLVFNGEIYNYIELRKELQAKGVVFQTQTDTEVLLKMWLTYGEDCLSQFNGMFAFVIYDRQEQSLFIARDRFGIKPLFYYQHHNKIYISSEIKSLRLLNKESWNVNSQTVFDYFIFNRTSVGENTFISEIKRFPKAHFSYYKNNTFSMKRWWNPKSFLKDSTTYSHEEIQENIKTLFDDAVSLRMRSDVSVGSCLSGGLDSSILVGSILDRQLAGKNFKTFSAVFSDPDLDESRYVDYLLEKRTFENFRVAPELDDLNKAMDTFADVHEEPTLNPAYYIQYEVMKLTKEHGVSVVLDGQGGDESFVGYPYMKGFYWYGLLKKCAGGRLFKELLGHCRSFEKKEAVRAFAYLMCPDLLKRRGLAQQRSFLSCDFVDSHFDESQVSRCFFKAKHLNESLALHFEYKMEHLLDSEDKNSMAFSLEARVPYLDHRLVEYMLSLPEEYKMKSGEIKYLQKQALGKYSDPRILNRRSKLGFNSPVQKWMDTSLWKEKSEKSLMYLKDVLPHIFVQDSSLPVCKVDRWKLTQFATWHRKITGLI